MIDCEECMFLSAVSCIQVYLVARHKRAAKSSKETWVIALHCNIRYEYIICGSYLRAATISANPRSLRHLFEGDYYSKCSVYLRKYGILCLLTNLTLPSQDSNHRYQIGYGNVTINEKRGRSALENDNNIPVNGRQEQPQVTV